MTAPGSDMNHFLKLVKDLANRLFWFDYTNTTNISAVYNPLEYAASAHDAFVQGCLSTGSPKKRVLFLGMNPGPRGMCQTGVPFGDVSMCQSFLGMSPFTVTDSGIRHTGPDEKVDWQAPFEVKGFSYNGEEVSGRRFWKLVREVSGTPEVFFRECFLYNLCPIGFFDGQGRNVTPSDIKGDSTVRKLVNNSCEEVLFRIVQLLGVEVIIGMGRYSEGIARKISKRLNQSVVVKYLQHPSPLSARGGDEIWIENSKRELTEWGVLGYMQPTMSGLNGGYPVATGNGTAAVVGQPATVPINTMAIRNGSDMSKAPANPQQPHFNNHHLHHQPEHQSQQQNGGSIDNTWMAHQQGGRYDVHGYVEPHYQSMDSSQDTAYPNSYQYLPQPQFMGGPGSIGNGPPFDPSQPTSLHDIGVLFSESIQYLNYT